MTMWCDDVYEDCLLGKYDYEITVLSWSEKIYSTSTLVSED